MFLFLQHFIYDYRLLKGEVDPNQEVEDEDEDEEKDHQADTEEDDTLRHHRKLAKFIAPPASIQQIKSELTHQVTNVTHQVTHVTHQVHKQFTDIFWVYIYYDI